MSADSFTHWQYDVVLTAGRNPDAVLKDAKEMGSQGWELVCLVGYDLYFKRCTPRKNA